MKSKTGGRRGSLFLLNFLLILIPVTLIGYRPVLRFVGSLLVVSEKPAPSDAIVVLAGGEPGRALEAADLYHEGVAPYVVVTTEATPRIFEEAKKHGVELFETYENYVRILEGYGVPEQKVIRIPDYVHDTLDEVAVIRGFSRTRNWKRLTVVTSKYHSRRSRLVCEYVLAPEIAFAVVASRYDSYDPGAWWISQSQIRTFAIEAEKLATYEADLGPRLLWRRIVR